MLYAVVTKSVSASNFYSDGKPNASPIRQLNPFLLTNALT
jgi:hypothetical protein